MKVSNHYSIPASKIGKTEIHLTHLKNPLVGEKKKKMPHTQKTNKKTPSGEIQKNDKRRKIFTFPITKHFPPNILRAFRNWGIWGNINCRAAGKEHK